MLQIDDLVFNAWGRRFFDHASVLMPGQRQGRPGRPQRRRQIHPVQADPGRAVARRRRVRAAPRARGSPAWTRSTRPRRSACSTPSWRPTSSGRRCTPNWKPPNRSASPTSTRGWRRSTPTARRRGPAKSWPGWASPPPTSRGRWPSSPAAGACAWRWPRRCSPNPTCCCWTNRPTTSTSKARCGWRRGCANTPTPRSSSAMTGNC